MTKEWSKWKLLDYRLPNRSENLRFDQILSGIKNKSIGPSDFICPPGNENFVPISECKELQYNKRKDFYLQTTSEDEQEQGIQHYLVQYEDIPINRRTAFVQENYLFTELFKKRKLSLIKLCSPSLKKILDLEGEEEINFIFRANADIRFTKLFSLLFPKRWFLDVVIILTSHRIIQGYINPRRKIIQTYKSVNWKNITLIETKQDTPKTFRVEIKLFNDVLFSLFNVSASDKVQFTPITDSKIKYTHKLKNSSKQEVWIRNTCNHCNSKLIAPGFECEICAPCFKNPDKAFRLAKWMPGIGFFYSGFPLLGVFWTISEFLIITVVTLLLLNYQTAQNQVLFGFSFLLLFLSFTHLDSAINLRMLVKEIRPLNN